MLATGARLGTRGRLAAAVSAVVLICVVLTTQRDRRILATYGEGRVPVGSGWSFFLDKRRVAGRPVFAPSGLQASGWWGGGTTIKDLQRHLTRTGRTLSAYPSIENGTIGGWIASGSHGSGGTLWTSNFGKVLVRDLETGAEKVVSPGDLFGKRARIAECRRYLILEVDVTPREDVCCERQVAKLLSGSDYEHFIMDPSFLRLLQVGRRGVFCIMWVPVPIDDADAPCAPCADRRPASSKTEFWLQSDVLTIFQSNGARDEAWFDFPVRPESAYRSREMLSSSNRYTMEPTFVTTPVGLFWTNFEVFVLGYDASAEGLKALSDALCLMFDAMSGRCELRLGKDVLFLDFNVPVGTDVSRIFRTLFPHLRSFDIVLHRGKAQVEVDPFVLAA